MTMKSPKEGASFMMGSKVNDSKEYRSPFKTNEDISRVDSQNHMMLSSNTYNNSV